MKEITIEGTITINDVPSKFHLSNNINGIGWEQYGATVERLGESMYIVEALQRGFREDVGFYNEEEE